MFAKPQVTFKVKSLEDTINIFTNFFETDDDLNNRTAKNIANKYGVDVEFLKGKSLEERKDYFSTLLTPIYNTKLNQMNNKISLYQQEWNKNANFICSEFEKIFRVKFTGVRHFTAYVNLNNVCPRYLNDDSFDIYYISTPENAIKTSIHELIHFYWFQVWEDNFPETDKTHFEYPYAEWLLSEIAVDPIIYFSKLNEFNFTYPAYDYFYKSTINEQNLIEFFRKLYKANNLTKFMERGLKILENNSELVKQLI